ncbi:hydrogenase maturation nickel metallochaperone HypA [Spirulina subsalsa]|uniref:hydrogenase maturation nickel metallochaperone HypA n=1 Tax=Spirulina subsalsa TaxID=54311 RepID=UPI00036FEA08|nr:hydrogenase maturation nickel metallochaperone HypA [Spirulina subsalsa]
MHEVSLMEQTLAIAFDHAQQQNAQRIHRLKMRIGAVSGVVPEALSFAFDVVASGTIAEGATLEIENVPVTCFCPDCDLFFNPPDLIYECPHCGSYIQKPLAGQEIELTSLEVS